jgi:hypothetical protein
VGGVCACPSGTAACGPKCIDLQVSPENCGACGKKCGALSTCQGGVCKCQSGAISCGGACLSGRTDDNCGACGVVCGAGTKCQLDFSGGALVYKCRPWFGTSCSAGLTQCQTFDPMGPGTTVCADIQNDVKHCGGCNQDCTKGPPPTGGDWCFGFGQCYCVAGKCKNGCTAPFQLCGGSTCTDVQTDPQNCGFCGTRCGPGLSCVAGQCRACSASETKCGGTCADLSSDPKNCGACESACALGASCSAGKCECPAGQQVACGWQPPRCIDFSSTQGSCGLCGGYCGGGATCSGGQCGCASGQQTGGMCI